MKISDEIRKCLMLIWLFFPETIYVKKIILGLIGLILVVVVAIWLFGREPKTMHVTDLPWQVEHTSTGATRVFGIILGQTSLDDASRHLNKVPEIALFQGGQGPESIEAFFGKTRVGVFDAKVVLSLDADSEILTQVAEMAGEPEPMPSGSWKRPVSEQALKTVLELPVMSITYVPSVQYEPDIVLRRFGEPSDKLQHNEHSEYWFYPNLGLVILLDTEGKEILQYVAPDRFGELRSQMLVPRPALP